MRLMTLNITTDRQHRQMTIMFAVEMGNNLNHSASVLFGFLELHGSVRFEFLLTSQKKAT